MSDDLSGSNPTASRTTKTERISDFVPNHAPPAPLVRHPGRCLGRGGDVVRASRHLDGSRPLAPTVPSAVRLDAGFESDLGVRAVLRARQVGQGHPAPEFSRRDRRQVADLSRHLRFHHCRQPADPARQFRPCLIHPARRLSIRRVRFPAGRGFAGHLAGGSHRRRPGVAQLHSR